MIRRQLKLHRRGGFTLIEVLISVSLLSIIMLLAWSMFHNTFKFRDIASAKFDRLRVVQTALRRMQSEISMAFVTKIGWDPTNEEMEQTYFTAFIGDNDRLDFSNFAHIRNRIGQAASEQCEIAYYLRPARGEDGRMRDDLVRREQAPIDGEPEEGGIIYTLLQDVHSIEFEYWREDREIAGDAWEPQWDTRDVGVFGLPTRVRITVEIPDPLGSDETYTFSVQTQIHLTEPIGFAYQALSLEDLPPEMQEQILETILDESSDEVSDDAFFYDN